jgi:hypothetical protein
MVLAEVAILGVVGHRLEASDETAIRGGNAVNRVRIFAAAIFAGPGVKHDTGRVRADAVLGVGGCREQTGGKKSDTD